MQYRMGDSLFDAETRYLTLTLPESSATPDQPGILRKRLEEDGFLLVRGLHDRQQVLELRRGILEELDRMGHLDAHAPLMEGVVSEQGRQSSTISVRGRERLKTELLKRIVYGPRVMGFFERLLQGPVLSYQFQWLRVVGPGTASSPHCDVVFMGRGTHELYTCWTPIGDIPPEMGPLALCLGSHRWQHVRDTYGRCDVDRDLIEGRFSDDPADLVERFGGRWATTSFHAGDAIIVSIYLMHASLTNVTDRFRISCDTRYQRADEPVDDRWAGETPRTHDAFWDPNTQLEPLAVSRRKWGV
jgi:hypothetical protein